MKSLREHIAKLAALVAAAEALATERRKAAQEIEEAVKNGDYSSDEHMRKLSNAQLRKTLIPAREKKLELEIAASQKELLTVYRQARQAWDNFVTARKEELFQRFLKAIEPFYGGPEKVEQTRREFEAVHVPARDALNRAFSPDFYNLEATAKDHLQWAQFLLTHAVKYSEKFGWGDPEKLQAVPRAPVKLRIPEPRKVRVRALETVVLPALLDVPVKGTTKRDSTIKAGTELDLDESQYLALSRFFKRI